MKLPSIPVASSAVGGSESVNKPSKRIAAFDLLRGCFLLIVIIDHVELFPSGFDFVTGRGQLWVSAAEGFFFLSGLLVGMIYRKKADPQAIPGGGMSLVFKKLWSRALLLYVCSVSLTLLFTAWALWHGNAEDIKYAAATNLGWDTIRNALELKYVYGWSDFLSYYVTFMVAAPFVIYLFTKRLWWLVVLVGYYVWLNRSINFTQAWQVLFFGGMMAGYFWKYIQATVGSWSQHVQRLTFRVVVAAAATTATISYLNLFVLDNLHNHYSALTPGWAGFVHAWDRINEAIWLHFDKFTLGPGRIAMFLLWFSAAFLIINRYASRIPDRLQRVLTLLGQNSLFVYGFHSILVFIVHAYLPKTAGLVFNFGITALVIAIMVAVTWSKVRWGQTDGIKRLRPKRMERYA